VKTPFLPLAVALLPLLAGCGSGAAPPFAVRCVTHRLPSGLIAARVTVRNTTDRTGPVIIYGPALTRVVYIAPVLKAAYVAVATRHVRRTYVGFLVPRVGSKKSAHILLRLTAAARAQSIVAGNRRTVHASSFHMLDNADCRVG
jgi:hypothetical protein